MPVEELDLFAKMDELISATERIANAVESMQADVASIEFETKFELERIREELSDIQRNTSP